MVHRAVLVRESVDLLVTKPDGVYVDATVGAGGHAGEILKRLGAGGRLLGIDRDSDILEQARERLAGDARVVLHHGSFEDLETAMRILGVRRVDGILADLGVSSLQLDRAERGFSFAKDAPLDMRMDPGEGITAADYLAEVSEKELERVLKEYGEERFARRIARRILEARRRQPIETTAALAGIVSRAVPRGAGRIHPATRTFQALRIAVNGELDRLDALLHRAPAALAPGGRLAILSYHSLEDRRVKRAFVEAERLGALRRLTKKPLTPSEDEVRDNPRSRSAKLRVAEKTEASS
ncbi:MAG TPA: 16S rRNA (cytosine(1402)-N(4))-methyltransferase RsmH [bacterium]|nr:16S rRNA (cytosine(1402)-N(4))-methyltransferase RsmH [bacterium]